ncbi:MAG: AAA family ATPase [Thermoplasmata archaeon]|nr:AAA family ATPase [Thermoplasmata archaeon]
MSPPGNTVFKDRGKLDFDYIPPRLPHRESQMEKMRSLFAPVETGGRQHCLLYGSVGTGKTATGRLFADELQKKLAAGGRRLDMVYINCRRRNTDKAVLLQMLRHFQPHFPDRGFSSSEMLDSLGGVIDKEDTHLLVILDEADVLLKKGTDIIYLLSRFDEETGRRRKSISLMLISQENVLNLMDPASLSTFGRTNVVIFKPYTAEELLDIVRDRVEMAFRPMRVGEEVMELVADIAGEQGDARLAIELLAKAGMMADHEGAEEVSPEYVRAAKAEIHSIVTESKLRELDTQKKLVLLASGRRLRKNPYATTGEVEDAYRVACEEYGETPRKHTQFWKYIKDLEALGLLDTKVRHGREGTTTLLTVRDLPAGELVRMLEGILSRELKKG